jgi:hypothetical protein
MSIHRFNPKAHWLLCKVCGGSERSLPTECPGYRLSYEELQHVLDRQERLQGRAVDRVARPAICFGA